MTTLPTRAPASSSTPVRRLPAPDRPATDTDTATGVTYVQAVCPRWWCGWNQDHHRLEDRGDRLLLWCPKCEHEHEVAT